MGWTFTLVNRRFSPGLAIPPLVVKGAKKVPPTRWPTSSLVSPKARTPAGRHKY
jgi:hypothetical protein